MSVRLLYYVVVIGLVGVGIWSVALAVLDPTAYYLDRWFRILWGAVIMLIAVRIEIRNGEDGRRRSVRVRLHPGLQFALLAVMFVAAIASVEHWSLEGAFDEFFGHVMPFVFVIGIFLEDGIKWAWSHLVGRK